MKESRLTKQQDEILFEHNSEYVTIVKTNKRLVIQIRIGGAVFEDRIPNESLPAYIKGIKKWK